MGIASQDSQIYSYTKRNYWMLYSTKGIPRSLHLFSCNERLDGHDKYKEMFKNNINIKASGYQHYLCPICPREVMSKFLNVVVNIN